MTRHDRLKLVGPERIGLQHATQAIGSYTQFGRVMGELNIETMCANTPQAKGRVERVNATLQDRLVKEMRLAGISSIDAAN